LRARRRLHARQHPDFRRADQHAIVQHDFPRAHILATAMEIRSALERFLDRDEIGAGIGDLDMRDSVRTVGYERRS
jgi:hypothetical protein